MRTELEELNDELDRLAKKYEQRFHQDPPWGLDSIQNQIAELRRALDIGVPLPKNIEGAIY